ncbi:membrane protein [Enterococcus alcedinis]|uniref:Membrane protein n=1 Tax=Enterococcus alcedinis TaxID=1274384 RepID=A0A917N3J9_9ENTE|nr:aromatic acid exporter family protein [Enterococcus alcedinis]MBP2101138.1 uncharacterized membrane protein YgaE (UPF0421/DUF939 family) [Enterococcus alcedinis]GGI64563.1 membrane protein [Enterococcus alcedinis]
MKIGLRTIKTVVACFFALIIAQQLELLYYTAAGIIAILSVGNTKKSSLNTGISRFVSLAIATALAAVIFNLVGYTPLGFTLYLVVFIPLTVRFSLTDSIVVTSVLVTHYLLEQNFGWELILNEILLMAIGVGVALLSNLYMPNLEKKIKQEQETIEVHVRQLLLDMADDLTRTDKEDLVDSCDILLESIDYGQRQARMHQENQWFEENWYYEKYFIMRRAQVRSLREMILILKQIQIEEAWVADLRILLTTAGETLSEGNDGVQMLRNIDLVMESYRLKPLPKNREEFENRARLFQCLQIFKNFIELKAEFTMQQ